MRVWRRTGRFLPSTINSQPSTNFGRQADKSWPRTLSGLAAPVPKTGSAWPRSERYRRLPPILTPKERRSHETGHALPKPVALSQELQTKSSNANSANTAQPGGPPGQSVWLEAANNRRPVAQKQSTRPISERTWSVTARDDQPSPVGLRSGKAISLGS